MALVLGTLLLLVLAVILIAAERDPVTRWLHYAWDWTLAKDLHPPSKEPEDPRQIFTAALAVLYTDQDEVDDLAGQHSDIRIRVEQYRSAYVRLARANRRVRRRLERGTLCLIAAFVIVIMLFGLVVIPGFLVQIPARTCR